MQANRNILYIYARKKHLFTGYPAAKHPKLSKFAITDIREKPVNFFHCSTRASTLVFTITMLTQIPLQRFLFLFIFIIPWFYRLHNLELCSYRKAIPQLDCGFCGRFLVDINSVALYFLELYVIHSHSLVCLLELFVIHSHSLVCHSRVICDT